VILDRAAGDVEQGESLNGAIVEVQMGQLGRTEVRLPAHRLVGLDPLAAVRGANREAVVLGGDVDPAARQVLDGVVGAAVAEGELERLQPYGPAQQLVAEADPHHRPLTDELPDRSDRVVERRGIARPVGQEDEVRIEVPGGPVEDVDEANVVFFAEQARLRQADLEQSQLLSLSMSPCEVPKQFALIVGYEAALYPTFPIELPNRVPGPWIVAPVREIRRTGALGHEEDAGQARLIPAVESIDERSNAYRNNLRQGDVIIAVNRIPVTSTNEFNEAISNHPSGEVILLQVVRQNSRFFVAFEPQR
jgi:hypothetical protein